jgi:pimeloyl-ACP methyl ester carboxylesterase
MEKYKELINQVKSLAYGDPLKFQDMLWKALFYSPKTPVKPYQRQQLDEAEKFSLEITDKFSDNKKLIVNGFKWGKGNHKVILTHGWASKAADFAAMIKALRQLNDITLIAFDAPGNGSSEGEFSDLHLFTEAVKSVIETYGQPDILIGHSLGTIANVNALQEIGNLSTSLLISLSPIIKLKENFSASLKALNVSAEGKDAFFRRLKFHFNVSFSDLDLNHIYTLDRKLKHWIAYDQEDHMSPYIYLQHFVNTHPDVLSQSYSQVGHARILNDPEVITDVLKRVHTEIAQNRKA